VGVVHKPLFGFGRLVMLAAMMFAAVALAGCGRKGSLDLPPSAAAGNPQQAYPAPSLGEQGDSPTQSMAPPPPAPQAAPPPPPAGRKWFPLDFLLN
jgi:predicted small lipoprotein YifL